MHDDAPAPSPLGHAPTDRPASHPSTSRPSPPDPLLFAGAADAATQRARALARSSAVPLTIAHGAEIAAAPEPAEAMRRALRDAVCYTEKRLARVFEGRLVAVTPLDVSPRVPGVPPARIAVTLAAEDDQRVLHLEGTRAWNLEACGARPGDIVQIARDGPFVTVRHDRNATEGRVLDERDHILRVRLGAIDQAHALAAATPTQPMPDASPDAPPHAPPRKAEAELGILLAAARRPEILLATAERPATGTMARAATDQWLRQRLALARGRLEPGILLVTDAASLSGPATAALRSALYAPAAPRVILADGDEGSARTTRERFPDATADRA